MGKHTRKNELRYSIPALVVLAVFVFIVAVVSFNRHQQNILQPTNPNRIVTKNTSTQPSNVSPSDVVTVLNQQRSTARLSALHWITQLDNAAQARANYDVANDTVSNTQGSPAADITNAGYDYSNYYLADVYDAANVQVVVNFLTSTQASDIGDTTSYSDVGVAVLPDTVNNNATQLVVVYFANQAPAATSNSSPKSSPSSNPAATTPYYCDPFVEYYPNGCPTD